ncbi:hypothetical protein RI543_004082 [Arxiozyma heterogenica]|uniref:Uncharacterized protein n=1 Tax=Arxiozyma heterogenica TaxID=278026 RepID=A0AAN7WHN2_9SACH|nr:hypothetical protein RI543_004082 [Kazachstania heterogenica]
MTDFDDVKMVNEERNAKNIWCGRCASDHQSNGKTKRSVRTIIEDTRALLQQLRLPFRFYTYAILASVNVRNCIFNKKIDAIIEKEQISEELAPQEILGENPITLQNIIIIKQEEYVRIIYREDLQKSNSYTDMETFILSFNLLQIPLIIANDNNLAIKILENDNVIIAAYADGFITSARIDQEIEEFVKKLEKNFHPK